MDADAEAHPRGVHRRVRAVGQDRRTRGCRRRPRACPRAGRARCTRRTGRPRRCLHPELPGPAVAGGYCRGHVDRSGSLSPSGSTDLRLLVAETHGYRLHLVDHPPAFDRDGLYGPPGGGDHADNAGDLRSCAAQRSSTSAGGSTGITPDVIHIHDWHTGPAALLRDTVYRDDPALSRAAIMLTVHNLAYHGWTPEALVPERFRTAAKAVGTRTASISCAPGSSAPSSSTPSARASPRRRSHLCSGWASMAIFGPGRPVPRDPERPRHRPMGPGDRRGSSRDLLAGRSHGQGCLSRGPARGARSRACGRPAGALDDRPARTGRRASISWPTRRRHCSSRASAWRCSVPAVPKLLRRSGHLRLAEGSRQDCAGRPLRPRPARQMYAGSDGFLMPSRSSPAARPDDRLRYGTPPIVRATGGLRDTVVDEDGAGRRDPFVFAARTRGRS